MFPPKHVAVVVAIFVYQQQQ